jgi:uncharacterized protein (DUF1778 family)
MATTSKPARLEARLSKKHQEVIQHAAALRGQSVTDFVIAASLAEAERAIASSSLIKLTVAEQKRLAGALLNPSPPNRALRRAFESHRELLDD